MSEGAGMSIRLRAIGTGMILAVIGAFLLGWRHQRTPGLATKQGEPGVEEDI
jgi:hypothetical protein